MSTLREGKRWPPFTDRELEALEWWQSHHSVHPFTCVGLLISHSSSVMRPFRYGLRCMQCEAKQAWVYEYTIDVDPLGVVQIPHRWIRDLSDDIKKALKK